MPYQIRSNIGAILEAVKTHLVTETGLASTAILWVQRSMTPHLRGDKDILLRAGRFDVDGQEVAAAGRIATKVTRILEITPRTRVGLDQSDRDDEWLLDTTRGYFELEDTIVDALQLFAPLDASRNMLTIEPMRLLGGSIPQKSRDPLWGDSVLLFQVKYYLDLDQTVNY